MNVVGLLTADLLAALEHPPDGVARHVLLWLDPEARFSHLVAQVAAALDGAGVRLLQLDSPAPQFELKLALLRSEATGGRAAVYLPGFDRNGLEPDPNGLPPLWSVHEQRLELARGAGAKRVLIPSDNKRDLADVPDDLLSSLNTVFYEAPLNAAIKAMRLE